MPRRIKPRTEMPKVTSVNVFCSAGKVFMFTRVGSGRGEGCGCGCSACIGADSSRMTMSGCPDGCSMSRSGLQIL